VDEGLRERKKRETRERISDMAMGLFMSRGFDNVTVAEVARAADHGLSQNVRFHEAIVSQSTIRLGPREGPAASRVAGGTPCCHGPVRSRR